MRHGSLESDAFRAAFLAETVGVAPSGARSFPAARERRMKLLADLAEEHLAVGALLSLAVDGAPARLPPLTLGATR